jgi:hypothetical protein
MLESLTEASFAPHKGTEFRIHINASTIIPVELVEVNVRGQRPPRASWDTAPALQREPFSLIFRGPLEQPLPQQMYNIDHAAIGMIEGLFLVPVGINPDGRFYEAVFT